MRPNFSNQDAVAYCQARPHLGTTSYEFVTYHPTTFEMGPCQDGFMTWQQAKRAAAKFLPWLPSVGLTASVLQIGPNGFPTGYAYHYKDNKWQRGSWK